MLDSKEVAPGSSELQRRVSLNGKYPPVPKCCVVTGGSGFVGLRLVEMLVERGAEKVVSFDVVGIEDLPMEVQQHLWKNPKISYIKGDITKIDDLLKAFDGANCVWHIAAAVGPFHPKEVYDKVNYLGTKNVVEACKKKGVKKIVMATSPSTRMNGDDIDGLTEAQLPTFEEMQGRFLQPYAESKFFGEKFCTNQCSDDLLTIAVAPHQVYGPRDNLFLPNLLEVAAVGSLRLFTKRSTGNGKNKVCFTHVDNYCHGLILAERALTKESKCKGKFYIITDADKHPFAEGYLYFWDELETIVTGLGFDSIKKKVALPYWFIMPIAYISALVGKLIGKTMRLSPFTVKMLTMHRWFNVDASRNDLGYTPIVGFREGWKDTESWFRQFWFPIYLRKAKEQKRGYLSSAADNTMKKINIQTESVSKKYN